MTMGIAARFGIIKGVRPHGFWAGPAVDVNIVFIKKLVEEYEEYLDEDVKKAFALFVPSAEFGWRYTFDFGLSLTAHIRIGAYVGKFSGFYLGTYWGVGYAIGKK